MQIRFNTAFAILLVTSVVCASLRPEPALKTAAATAQTAAP